MQLNPLKNASHVIHQCKIANYVPLNTLAQNAIPFTILIKHSKIASPVIKIARFVRIDKAIALIVNKAIMCKKENAICKIIILGVFRRKLPKLVEMQSDPLIRL